jgi:immune inhibitor A
MSRSVALPAGTVTLTAQVNYQIELDWDYAYLTVNGTPVESDHGDAPGAPGSPTNLNGQNFGWGITGSTGGNWVTLTADLSAFAGQTVDIGFRYWTDGFVTEPGFMVDEIAITGQPVDGAESNAGWTFDGFSITTGQETSFHFNAYLAEFRQYRGNDTSLATAYNFGFIGVNDDWVEFYPFQDGLLISYWDTSQTDNNTSFHPGEGEILPIDAHPVPLLDAFGNVWRNRVQSYDSTFTFAPTDAITLHKFGEPSYHPSLPGVSVFNDMNSYWDPANPNGSVIVPNTGTTIRIKSISAHGSFMQVAVNK